MTTPHTNSKQTELCVLTPDFTPKSCSSSAGISIRPRASLQTRTLPCYLCLPDVQLKHLVEALGFCQTASISQDPTFKANMTLKAKLRKKLSSRSLSGKSRSKIIPAVPDIDPFCHSEPLENDPQRPSEAFTTLPSRLHKQDVERVESVKLFSTEMMSAISQPQSDFSCHLDTSLGHASSLLFPECLPERLDALVMVLEGAAIHHGMNDVLFPGRLPWLIFDGKILLYQMSLDGPQDIIECLLQSLELVSRGQGKV